MNISNGLRALGITVLTGSMVSRLKSVSIVCKAPRRVAGFKRPARLAILDRWAEIKKTPRPRRWLNQNAAMVTTVIFKSRILIGSRKIWRPALSLANLSSVLIRTSLLWLSSNAFTFSISKKSS